MCFLHRAGRPVDQLRVPGEGAAVVPEQSADSAELDGRIQQAGPALLGRAVGHSVRRVFQIMFF